MLMGEQISLRLRSRSLRRRGGQCFSTAVRMFDWMSCLCEILYLRKCWLAFVSYAMHAR